MIKHPSTSELMTRNTFSSTFCIKLEKLQLWMTI